MKRIKNIFVALLILLIYSCSSDPEFNDIPQIEFISFSKDSMVQNSLNTDSVFLKIAFKDGDGDIGSGAQGITENIRLTDTRTGFVFDRFKIPELPISGVEGGIEGEITMKVFTSCCIFPDGTPPCLNPPDFPSNELRFDIEMFDDNGNRSNKVSTSLIILLCN